MPSELCRQGRTRVHAQVMHDIAYTRIRVLKCGMVVLTMSPPHPAMHN